MEVYVRRFIEMLYFDKPDLTAESFPDAHPSLQQRVTPGWASLTLMVIRPNFLGFILAFDASWQYD